MFRKILLLAPLLAMSAATGSQEASRAAGPEPAESRELQRAILALAGSWTISEEYAPSAIYPQGGLGRGTEIWRAGPGNTTFIYEYHSTNPGGEMWATAVLWWDPEAKRLRELWCTSRSKTGCVVSTADIRWEGEDFVFTDSYEVNGQRVFSREVWSDMKPDTHTMTISDSTTNSDPRPWIVSHAARVR
jgi:hypothetical protein